MSYKKINNITGWIIFLIALIVYTATMEASASWWDCGEFISATYKLQVVHPPGAPIFLMIGRIFSLFASSPDKVPLFTNFFSALSTALAILFCFWIITRMAKKMLVGKEEATRPQIALIMISGIIGAGCCMFCDSIWFSAVESEVYAMATFSFVLIFWAIIKWEEHADEPNSDRWILFIALALGLSLGVHLLALLAIPAIGLVYYFRNYTYSRKGFWAAMGISLLILGVILFGVLDKFILIAALLDRMFVNNFGLPFGSGILFYIVIVFGAMIYGVRYAHRKGNRTLHLAIMSFMMLIIGLSSYTMVIIRAKADPPLNMNGINDVNSFLSYLRREQYGSRDLVFGHYWTAEPLGFKITGTNWGKVPGNSKYVAVSKDIEYDYATTPENLARVGVTGGNQQLIDLIKARNKSIFFPRMGSTEDRHSKDYYNFVGVSSSDQKAQQAYTPTYGDNMDFFFRYQLGYMFWRYFMWNFSGRQNDSQGYYNEGRDGNWITGVPVLDKTKNPVVQNLPPSMANVPSHNVFFMIPFILGLIGMIYQLRKDWKSWFVLFIFFFFMGVMNLINSNEPPVEPRERDYALVGAFFVFAIWIGFGALALFDMIKNRDKKNYTEYFMYGGISVAVMFITGLTDYNLVSFLMVMVYALAVVALLVFLIGAISKALKSDYALAIIIGVVCLSAPVLMGSQGWDDHNRSNRTFARDFARNYLNSCPPNAILFTQGDNDTYPLWYAQEVEGIRTDVRIVNLSLLGVDWYINQLRHKINNADAIELSLSADKILGDKRNGISYNQDSPYKDKVLELSDVVKFMGSDEKSNQNFNQGLGEAVNYIPTKKFKLAVDTAAAVKDGIVPANLENNMTSEMTFNLRKNTLLKNDLMVMDIVANNAWKRPICFAVTVSGDSFLGLEKYFMHTNMVYRLTPVESPDDKGVMTGLNKQMNNDVCYDMLVTHQDEFTYGGIERGNKIYKDQSSLNSALTAKYLNYQSLADNLTDEMVNYQQQADQMLKDSTNADLKEVGSQLKEQADDRRKKAVDVLDLMIKDFPNTSMPYDYNMVNAANLYQVLGQNDKSKAIIDILSETCLQDLNYYFKMAQIGGNPAAITKDDMNNAQRCIYVLIQISNKLGDKTYADGLQTRFIQLLTQYNMPNPYAGQPK